MGCSFTRQSIIFTKAFQKILIVFHCKPKKYGWITGVNFTIDHSNHDCRIMIENCI